MPHLVIEYSRDIEDKHDMVEIMQAAYDAGVETGEMNPPDIKVRAKPYDFYRLAKDGDSFLHMTVFLLTGRSNAQKTHIGEILLECLQSLLGDVTTISIDLRDMNRDVYQKRVLKN